jgi:prepilin-type N-terminal cleavage/methylation domain-containing protein
VTPNRGGFTLIELLVVITIIGILIGLMFPIYSTVIRSAQETQCQGNIGQLAKVVIDYCQANDGYFPTYSGMVGSYQHPSDAGDWLFVADQNLKPVLTSASSSTPGDMERGLLFKNKLIGKFNSFYCPTDVDLGLVRGPSSTAIDSDGNLKLSNYLHYRSDSTGLRYPATSYVINSSITYGNQSISGRRLVRKLSEFGAWCFMFIEESSNDTERGEEPSTFRTAYMGAGTNETDRAMTSRHHGGGYVACMDGHVEWMIHRNKDDPNDPGTFKASRDLVASEASRTGKAWYYVNGTRWSP